MTLNPGFYEVGEVRLPLNEPMYLHVDGMTLDYTIAAVFPTSGELSVTAWVYGACADPLYACEGFPAKQEDTQSWETWDDGGNTRYRREEIEPDANMDPKPAVASINGTAQVDSSLLLVLGVQPGFSPDGNDWDGEITITSGSGSVTLAWYKADGSFETVTGNIRLIPVTLVDTSITGTGLLLMNPIYQAFQHEYTVRDLNATPHPAGLSCAGAKAYSDGNRLLTNNSTLSNTEIAYTRQITQGADYRAFKDIQHLKYQQLAGEPPNRTSKIFLGAYDPSLYQAWMVIRALKALDEAPAPPVVVVRGDILQSLDDVLGTVWPIERDYSIEGDDIPAWPSCPPVPGGPSWTNGTTYQFYAAIFPI